MERVSRRRLMIGLAALPLAGCAAARYRGSVRADLFGTLPDGDPVMLFTLTNAKGSVARVMSYGAAVTHLLMPDRQGRLDDVVLGLDDLESYRTRSRNFGTIVGRFAGRIADGRFILDGKEVRLDTGNSKISMHGGPVGFAKRNWRGELLSGAGVRLTLVSADGDQGFPGELTISVTYRLTDDDALCLDFHAVTTKPTVLNPTHHSYFNLSGLPGSNVHDHVLTLAADRFIEMRPDKIATGRILHVAGMALDFRTPKPIGRDLISSEDHMRIAGGYDHCYVIRGKAGQRPRFAARAQHPGSGRVVELWTTEPGVQLFTANNLNLKGRNGATYGPHAGLCLEPQHFQDSPNRPEFPSTVLRPGQVFRSHSEYRFNVA